MKNFYKIENNYPMTYQGELPLDDTWKEFTVTDGVYEPKDLNDLMLEIEAKEFLNKKINEAKAYLSSTDYKMTVDYFATLSQDVKDELIRLRAEARQFIRENEA